MIKNILGIFLIVFFLGDITAQKEDFNWEFGNRIGNVYGTEMDFNTQPVTVRERPGGVWYFHHTCTSISSDEGKLLFYTNGIHIYDRRHEVMKNGDTLHPTSYTQYMLEVWPGHGTEIKQNVLILPFPGRENIYFMMHHSVPQELSRYKDFSLLYSTVDMSKNHGYGAVVQKNQHILTDTLAPGRLTACRHANGRDWWILTRRVYGSNLFYRFLLSPDGLELVGTQSIGDSIRQGSGYGQAAFSPDGDHYAFLTYYSGAFPYKIDVYDFDRCSGMLSNPNRLIYNSETDRTFSGSGLAYSQNSRFLYASTTNYIYQYEMHASNIEESRKLVGTLGDFKCPGLDPDQIFNYMQLAPNGKIYIAGEDYCALSEIRYPDYEGMQCGVMPGSVQMITPNRYGIPDFPVYRLGPEDGSVCDTLGIEKPPVARFRPDSVRTYRRHFTDISWFQPTEWHWDFGDGTTSSSRHVYHTYSEPGEYEVCLTVSNEDGEDTTCDTVIIKDQSTGFYTPEGKKNGLNVYPIPSGDQITIEGLEHSSTVQIFNNTGEVMETIKVSKPTVTHSISGFEPGIYWIRTGNQSAKFIKQ